MYIGTVSIRASTGLLLLLPAWLGSQAVQPGSLEEPSTALLREARVAAAKLPSPLAERELGIIADDEEVTAPQQALADFRKLYNEVHLWPEGLDDDQQKIRTRVRSSVEEDAIDAFARQGQFDQALAWLAEYDAVNHSLGWPAGIYSGVMLDMIRQHNMDLIFEAVRQCRQVWGEFPFGGVGPLLRDEDIPVLDRMSVAREGLQAVPDAPPDVISAARFLNSVHTAFPKLDNEVEDAAIALLHAAEQDLGKDRQSTQPRHVLADTAGGPLVFALLDELDPQRAQSIRSQYPKLTTGDGQHLALTLSPDNKVVGAGIGRGPVYALSQKSQTDPGKALAGAEALKDPYEHFEALAALAQSMAKSHPAKAVQAANDAYALLDKPMAYAEDGYTLDLANAFLDLGQTARAAEIANMALDAALTHATESNEQFDLSIPDGIDQAIDGMALPLIGMTYVFNRAAIHWPKAALTHVRACDCNVLGPLLLSKLAEGMTPAGAKEPY